MLIYKKAKGNVLCMRNIGLLGLLDLTLLLMLFPFLPPPSGTVSLRMFDHALTRPLSNRD